MSKKIVGLLVFAIALCVCNNVCASRIKIAILDFKAGVGQSQSQVDGLADMLGVELYNSGYFTVIERGQLEAVLRANNISSKSMTESQKKMIAEKLQVDAVLVGTVNFSVQDVKTASDGSSRLNVGEYNVDARIVRVDNGEWISSAGIKYCGTERELMTKLAQQLARNIDKSVVSPTSPYLLLGYLYVFPEDMGSFTTYPSKLIEITNKQVLYNFRDWRLPSQEELELLEANARQINLTAGVQYAYEGMRWDEERRVRLVRSKIMVQQNNFDKQEPYFESAEYDFGIIPMLSGSVKHRFCLMNPTPFDIEIETVTKTNSSISVSWTTSYIKPGERGYVYVTYNPNGRQGVEFKRNAIQVKLGNGKIYNLYVSGQVR